MSNETIAKLETTKLSARQHQVMLLMIKGRSSEEIGKLLGISLKTVETHRSNMHKKLGTKTSLDIVRRGLVGKTLSISDLI